MSARVDARPGSCKVQAEHGSTSREQVQFARACRRPNSEAPKDERRKKEWGGADCVAITGLGVRDSMLR